MYWCLAPAHLRLPHALWTTNLPSLASWRPLQLQHALAMSAPAACNGRRSNVAASAVSIVGHSSDGQSSSTAQQPLQPGLYLVSTPLGNLSDFSRRAVDVLAGSSLILAENPRHSAVLLQAWGVKGARAAGPPGPVPLPLLPPPPPSSAPVLARQRPRLPCPNAHLRRPGPPARRACGGLPPAQ